MVIGRDLKLYDYSRPILEFKESFRRVPKGHPTLVTQVDLILQN